jgi:hypothetical protein
VTQLVAQPYFEPADVVATDVPPPPTLLSRLTRPIAALRGVPNLTTWLGVTISAAGLVLIAIAWGRTAALTNVALQTPYVISAGFTGLGLVVVGVTMVSIAAKRADAAERIRQLRELREVLADLRRQIEELR